MNCKRIIKECFWEYDFSEEEIKKLSSSDNLKEQKFLFEKILLNSTSLFNDLRIFKSKDLERLIIDYRVPKFNHDYIFKRKNMAEVFFLDKPVLVNELKWIA